MCIWRNEEVCEYAGTKRLNMRVPAGKRHWYNGTICMEVKLHPRHISNYATICIKFTPKKESETEICIYAGEKQYVFESKVLPFNRRIQIGLLREFEEAIEEFLFECPREDLPSGSIEILYGGFDEVGSSKISFKKAMELLVFIFQKVDRINEEQLKQELLRRM